MNESEYFEKIKEFELLAKHNVGQNFLIDSRTCERIISLLFLTKEDYLLEIGFGAGSLSYFINLTHTKAKLIDIDELFVTKLQTDFKNNSNLEIVQENIFNCDLGSFNKIVGNLPYYITSKIIEKIILEGNNNLFAVLMIQKEAYQRLVSNDCTKDYGPLGIMLSLECETKKEFNVNRNLFVPKPHVDSTLFSIKINSLDSPKLRKELYNFLNLCFSHRRKTIFNNLSNYFPKESVRKILNYCKIDEKIRPEQISPKKYLELFKQCNLLKLC